tara:strand:+ start:67 stop:189 length:123 start_codon:yes stop_codon:yes gene_type:complete
MYYKQRVASPTLALLVKATLNFQEKKKKKNYKQTFFNFNQ